MSETIEKSNIEVALRGPFTAHGEDIVRSRMGEIGEGVTTSPFVWPKTVDHSADWRDQQTLVAAVDGAVAGRAVLEAVAYPFAELVNLEVMPAFRGRGAGSHLVSEALRRAAEMGFSLLHIQCFLNEIDAHRLYARHGFLPANQGEMLRMIRFVDYPALSHFLWEHPLATFQSRPAEEPGASSWDLSWTDPIDGATLRIGLSGASCQFDSDGFGPGVKTVLLTSGKLNVRSTIDGPVGTEKKATFEIGVEIANAGSEPIKVACRLLLNQGFAPAPESQGAGLLSLEPGEAGRLALPVQVLESFDDGLWRWRSFPSVPVSVEVFVGEYVYWLSHQIKVGSESP